MYNHDCRSVFIPEGRVVIDLTVVCWLSFRLGFSRSYCIDDCNERFEGRIAMTCIGSQEEVDTTCGRLRRVEGISDSEHSASQPPSVFLVTDEHNGISARFVNLS